MVDYKKYGEYEKIEAKNVSQIHTIKGQWLKNFPFDDKKEGAVSTYIIYLDAFGTSIKFEAVFCMGENDLKITG